MLDMAMFPEMGMRVTPALLNLTQMLTLPTMELHRLVQQELSENPALEEIEISADADSSESYQERLLEALRPGPEFAEDDGEFFQTLSDDDATDPLLFMPAPRSLAESLLADLRASLPERDYPVAEMLIGSLDEEGFLKDQEDLTHIAETLGIEQDRVDTVLRRLQEIGPPGIATSDLRSCLLAQVDALESAGVSCPYVREVIGEYLDDFGAHRYRHIAQQLHISPADVDAVRTFVQQQLWPYPAQSLLGSEAAFQRPRYVLPDVEIQEQSGKFVVEVLNSPCRILCLNPLYSDLSRRAASLDEESRLHVHNYISRARTFLTNLRQRELTLQQISEAIVVHQEAFLRYGVRHLAPLTRAEIAAEVGLHESTVSRAITEKTVLLPDGVPMAFSDFFVAARGVQDVMRELIENETKPLSDAELARILTERGYVIARRTVAKYREQMNILPSKLR